MKAVVIALCVVLAVAAVVDATNVLRRRAFLKDVLQDDACLTGFAAGDEKCSSAGGACSLNSCPCKGTYKSGLCGGKGPRQCCVPDGTGSNVPPPAVLQGQANADTAAASPTPAPAAAGKTGPVPPPAGGVKKIVCLTYDDGPYPPTHEILDVHKEITNVPATWFVNWHDDAPATADVVKRIVTEGHMLANHMYSHDIMATGQYQKSYGTAADQKKGTATQYNCLKTEEQQNLFVSNYERNLQSYTNLLKSVGISPPPANLFKVTRFPGDGRFQQCLIAQVSNKDSPLVTKKNVHVSSHAGWHYEVAPQVQKATGVAPTFGHVINDAVTKDIVVNGLKLLTTESSLPADGSIMLAHDLHYKGKVDLLRQWITKLRNNGYGFALLTQDGGCTGANGVTRYAQH